MILNFFLALIPLAGVSVLFTILNGSSVLNILDLPSFLGVLLVFACGIFICGYGKDFLRIFSTKKKFSSLSLCELQKTEFSLVLASKILMYTALLMPVLVLIFTLKNFNSSQEVLNHLGKNLAVILLSILYLCLFELDIFTLKAKVRKHEVLYMSENDDVNFAEDAEQKVKVSSIVKVICGFVLIAALFVLYAYVSGAFSWGKTSFWKSIIDLPSFAVILLFVLPLAAISENFTVLFKSFCCVFTSRKISITDKNLFLNAVKSTAVLNWLSALSAVIISWISILSNIEDSSTLASNFSVSLIPFFYAVILNLVLLIVEIKVNKVSE